MYNFFKYSNTEGKIFILMAIVTCLLLFMGLFIHLAGVLGLLSLGCSFILGLIILPDARFGKDDPPDENALL